MSAPAFPRRTRDEGWKWYVSFRQLQTNGGKGRIKQRQGYADHDYFAEARNARWSYRVSAQPRGGTATSKVFRNRQPKSIIPWIKEVVT